jgi:hypothetical protein
VATLDPDSRDEVPFTRLLTDDRGRLMDATELGLYASARLAQAIQVRAGTCRFPRATSLPTAAILIITSHGRTEGRRRRTSIRYAGATTAARPSPGWPASVTTTWSIGPCPMPRGIDASMSRCQLGSRPKADVVLAAALSYGC